MLGPGMEEGLGLKRKCLFQFSKISFPRKSSKHFNFRENFRGNRLILFCFHEMQIWQIQKNFQATTRICSCLSHIFTKTFGETNIFAKILTKTNIFAYISQNLTSFKYFLTKMVSVFHMLLTHLIFCNENKEFSYILEEISQKCENEKFSFQS